MSKTASAPADDPLFLELIASLAQNAALFLGQIADPQSGETHLEPELARHFIDQLCSLEGKTAGNLSPTEAGFLHQAIHNLQLVYLRIAPEEERRPAPGGATPAGEAPAPAPTPPAPGTATDPGATSQDDSADSKRKFIKSYGP